MSPSPNPLKVKGLGYYNSAHLLEDKDVTSKSSSHYVNTRNCLDDQEEKLYDEKYEDFIDILSWNAHSVDSLHKQLFINYFPYDIACIQETWGINNQTSHLPSLPNNCALISRDKTRGGGTLTLPRKNIQVHSEFIINKDTKLLRVIINSNKVLWICNSYLNQGRTCQIQKIFKSVRNLIPPSELDRVIIIGDLNVNLDLQSDARVKLLKTLSKELGLIVLEPLLRLRTRS